MTVDWSAVWFFLWLSWVLAWALGRVRVRHWRAVARYWQLQAEYRAEERERK